MLELAGIVILGILAQWVAWRFKIPAILPLILVGLLVGPIAAEFLSEDGKKWIEPIWNGETGLFPEVLIENKEHYQSILELTKSDKDIIPIFLKDTNDELIIISSDNSQIEVGEDWKLIYLGKPIDVEKIDL